MAVPTIAELCLEMESGSSKLLDPYMSIFHKFLKDLGTSIRKSALEKKAAENDMSF
jgi:hypothetical protein